MKRKFIFSLVLGLFVSSLFFPSAIAQEIPISISGAMDKVIFDGKWTFEIEWKNSSQDRLGDDIALRSAHQDNFIYIMFDVVQDKTFDNNKDSAIVCFDTKNDQNVTPDENDYCFMAKLGSNKPVTLQGSAESGEFEIIENHKDLIAIGGISDENDRYSKVPHTSYEFKIPLELLERKDIYGFYVGVFDFAESQTFTWPREIILDSNSDIPSPSKWGIIYSPDKSLPEYDLPIVVLILGSFFALFLSYKNKTKFVFINR